MLKVPLLVASLASAASLTAPDGSVRLNAPPGWIAVKARPPAIFRLEGPLHDSLIVSLLAPTEYLYNRPALSQSLERLMRRVAGEAGVVLELDPKLRHLSLGNGADVDYRVGRAPGRPSMVLGICRFSGSVFLVQAVGHHAETNVREVLGSLAPAAGTPATPPPPSETFPIGALVLFWAATLLATLLAMLYWAIQLRKPSRFLRR